MPDVFTMNCVAGVVFSAFGFIVFTYGKRMGYWTPMLCGLALMLLPLFVAETNGLLDADALRSRINAVAALCGRCCFACRQHASGNGGNRLSPYLDRQKNRAAIQRIIRSAEATFACCRCNSEMLTRPIDGEIHFLD